MRDYNSIIMQTDPSFQRWLANLQDDIIRNDIVCLYTRESLVEQNEINEMESYLPNHIMIGDDSGDMGFLLEINESSSVWIADVGTLSIDDLEIISPSFSVWKESNYALPKEEEYHLPLQADIYIDQVNDLKSMFALNKFLSLNWSASQMKQFLEQQPVIAIQSGAPIAIEQRLLRNPELQSLKKCLYYSEDKKLKQIYS